MGNIEILAELKAMYHFITDITENAEEEQIADNDFEEFEKMETFLEKQYAKWYNEIIYNIGGNKCLI